MRRKGRRGKGEGRGRNKGALEISEGKGSGAEGGKATACGMRAYKCLITKESIQ